MLKIYGMYADIGTSSRRFKSPDYVAPITTWDVGAVNENDDDGDEGDSSVTYLYHYRTRGMCLPFPLPPSL